MSKDIYDENKRFKQEIDDLRGRLVRQENHQRDEADAKFMMAVVLAIFKGEASLYIGPGNDAGALSVRVELPPALRASPEAAS